LAFNGSGVFNRVHSWAADLAGAVPVTASRQDAEDDGIATGLSTTICRDGQSTTTARIPFAAGTSAAAGTTASVAYSQTNDNNTGMYFPATDQWGLVAGGTAVLTGTATGVAVTGTLTTSGALTPSSSDGAALGSASVMWSDLFLASGAVINFNNGNATMTHAAGSLTTAVTTFAITGALTVSTTAAITGNATFGGTVGVTGATTLSSTLAAGATTITGALSASGDFAIATNKLTVASASGNTAVAGTLAVTGATTATGAVTANNAAGVTARNTAKCFVSFTTDGSGNVTIAGTAFNVTSIAAATVGGQSGFRLTFATALATDDYTAVLRATFENNIGTSCLALSRLADQATTTFDFIVSNVGVGPTRNNVNCHIAIFENA
jgi:hypothetical protein